MKVNNTLRANRKDRVVFTLGEKKCTHNQFKKEYCLRACGTTDNSKLTNRLRIYLYCRVKVFTAN